MVTMQRFCPPGLYTQSTVTSASKTSSGCVYSEQRSWGHMWDMLSDVTHEIGKFKKQERAMHIVSGQRENTWFDNGDLL